MTIQFNEPLSIEQVFSHGFSLFKATWRKTLPLIIFLAVIILTPSFWFYNPDEPLLFFGYFFFSLYVFSTLFYYMDKTQLGEQVDLKTALIAAGRKFWIIALATIYVSILTLIGYALFIIPGILVTVWLSMVIPLILFNGAGVFDVIRKSYELTTDEWWRTALVVFLPIALMSLIGLPLQEAVWNRLISLETYRIIRKILFLGICLWYTPWVTALLVVQFEDLKRRQAIRRLAVSQ